MKMRFRILANPIQYHNRDIKKYMAKINNTMWACAVLHNLLLAYDGLDKLWTEDVCEHARLHNWQRIMLMLN